MNMLQSSCMSMARIHTDACNTSVELAGECVPVGFISECFSIHHSHGIACKLLVYLCIAVCCS